MKIMYINTLFFPNGIGGAEKIVQNLSNGMKERRHEVVVLTLIPPNSKAKISDIDGIKVYYLPLENTYWPFDGNFRNQLKKIIWHIRDTWNVKMALIASEIIETENPDVIHIHNLSGFSPALLKKINKKYPVILTAHDYYFKCYRSTMFRNGKNCDGQCLDCRILSVPRKIYSNRVDTFVGVSNFVLDRMTSSKYFLKSSKIVIHNSVEKITVKPKHHKKSAAIVFGYIGRITEEKGFSTILEALQKVKGEWRFVFAGSGDANLIQTALEMFSGRVEYLGFVKPADFYSQIDLLIIPSLWNDPYPTVGLEALSAGVPVMGRRVGGVPEIVAKFDKEFIFIENSDLSRKLNDYIDQNLADAVISISANESRILEIYDMEEYLKKYEEIYIETKIRKGEEWRKF